MNRCCRFGEELDTNYLVQKLIHSKNQYEQKKLKPDKELYLTSGPQVGQASFNSITLS